MQVFQVGSSLALNCVVYTTIYIVLGFCLVYIVCFRNSADSGGYVERRNPCLVTPYYQIAWNRIFLVQSCMLYMILNLTSYQNKDVVYSITIL